MLLGIENVFRGLGKHRLAPSSRRIRSLSISISSKFQLTTDFNCIDTVRLHYEDGRKEWLAADCSSEEPMTKDFSR